MINGIITWGTQLEKQYIDYLAKCGEKVHDGDHKLHVFRHTPKELLKNYIKSAKRREAAGTFWLEGDGWKTHVDGAIVIGYAERRLERLK